MWPLTHILLFCFALYLAAICLVLSLGNRLLFLPQTAGYQDSAQIIKITTPNQQTISAQYFHNPTAYFTVIMSHGNAEDLAGITPLAQALAQHNISVIVYDYQGYGTSTGTPTEQHTYQDIAAVNHYATHTLKIPQDRIILYGRSLGSGVSIDHATRNPVAGLIVESGFVSAWRVVTVWPILPFDRYKNIDKIAGVNCPVLFIHGTQDRIVAPWHGQKLYDTAKFPKSLKWIQGGGHNSLWMVGQTAYLNHMITFIHSLEPSSPSG